MYFEGKKDQEKGPLSELVPLLAAFFLLCASTLTGTNASISDKVGIALPA